MNYRLTHEASIDLENIWVYTLEKWSREQADKYINIVLNEIELLAIKPSSGEDYKWVREGYKRLRVKSHFIFYKINIEQNEVEIIRILHQRMDLDTHLNK